LSQVIDGCYVTDSSGCHRYDYWNEQALFDGREDTGWCTPSRTAAQREFLEVDLGGLRRPNRVRLQARPIKDHPGFPREIRALTRSAGPWTTVLAANEVHAEAGQWWEGDLIVTDSRFLRLEFGSVGWRSNGSYFLQFMQLEILEETP
jgi:hypothetical protein